MNLDIADVGVLCAISFWAWFFYTGKLTLLLELIGKFILFATFAGISCFFILKHSTDQSYFRAKLPEPRAESGKAAKIGTFVDTLLGFLW